MNYLSHAFRFLDEPDFALGTQIPDFLNMVDRKVRARRKLAAAHVDSPDSFVAQVAAGVVQHHDDDHQFHGSLEFTRLNHELSTYLREQRPDQRGLRSWFVGHIAIEMLLDWAISQHQPDLLDRLYELFREIPPERFQQVIEQITGKSAPRVIKMHGVFLRERFLFDYQTDEGLLYRINRILERLGLEPYDETDDFLMAHARQQVDQKWRDLLTCLTPPSRL